MSCALISGQIEINLKPTRKLPSQYIAFIDTEGATQTAEAQKSSMALPSAERRILQNWPQREDIPTDAIMVQQSYTPSGWI